MNSGPKTVCSTTPTRASIVGAKRSTASRARSGPLIPIFGISQLLRLRNWATAGAFNGYRAALAMRHRTLGLTSSLPGTVELPPFIFFSTSYFELECRTYGNQQTDDDRRTAEVHRS